MPTKTLRVTYSAEEYDDLLEGKGDRTWKEAIFEEVTPDE